MQDFLTMGDTKWIHLTKPTLAEIQEIIDTYDVHDLIEDDIMEASTQDKIDVYDQYIFLVLHFPKYDQNLDKYFPNEFNIILGKNFIISMTSQQTNHIESIRQKYEQDLAEDQEVEAYKASPYYILYTMLDVMCDKVLTATNKFSHDLHLIEEELFVPKGNNKYLLERIVIKRRNDVFLKHMLVPQEEILEELHKATINFYGGDLDVYFEDLQYKIDKIMHHIQTIHENTESLADTYNTLANIQTNKIITLLTIFTAVIGMMTFITGLYGMNVVLPGQDAPAMFYALGGGMIVVAVIMMLFFKRKRRL